MLLLTRQKIKHLKLSDKTPEIVENLPLCMQGRQNPHKTKDKIDTSRNSYGSEFNGNVRDSKM